jgi:hypothetical protein
MLLGEQDVRRSDRMEPEEATGGHEREREQQDTRVTSPIGRLARRVTENERHRADDAEDDKVEPVVLDVRISRERSSSDTSPTNGNAAATRPMTTSAPVRARRRISVPGPGPMTLTS